MFKDLVLRTIDQKRSAMILIFVNLACMIKVRSLVNSKLVAAVPRLTLPPSIVLQKTHQVVNFGGLGLSLGP